MGIETIAAISLGTAVVGAGVGAYGASQAGKASKNAFTYQAQVAKNNADIAKANANYQRASGETEAAITGVKQREQMGATKSQQSASGLDVNSGSPLAVRESQSEINSFDQMMIRSNAQRTAYGSDVEATNQLNQRTIDIMAGDQAKRAGNIGSLTSVIGGASSVSDKWLKFSQAGVFG